MTTPVPGFPSRFPVRSDDRRPWRYRFVSGLARLIFRLRYGLHPIDFQGMANIPAKGPVIVASNHLSNLDPVLMGAFFPRTLFAMAKRELFPNRVVAWMWAGCNTFPVDRGTADRRALRTAIDVLHRGGRLLLFIEGTRATSPGMKRAEPGVGFMLRRASVGEESIPVLPVGIWGTERALVKGKFFPQRVPMHVRFGKPFTLPMTAARDDQSLADQVAARVAALLPPEYRGVYSAL